MLYRLVGSSHWDSPRLANGDFKAVLFGDFRVDSDGISAWAEPVELAVQVMASGFRKIRAVTVLEIPETLMDDIGILVTASPGLAPDSASEDLHRNIECNRGSLLVELIDRLSQEPSLQRFDTARVRTLLAQRVGVGVDLDQLKPRVVDDLIRAGHVAPADGQDVLGALINDDPCVLKDLKFTTARNLIEAGIVSREHAELLHPGFDAS